MTVEYDYYTGVLSELEGDLKRSMIQYLRNNEWVKVGITNNPEIRWSQHKSEDSDWSKMVVVYKSSSIKNVKKIEKILVDHGWDRANLANEIGGGGGSYGEGDQYVYFLIQR